MVSHIVFFTYRRRKVMISNFSKSYAVMTVVFFLAVAGQSYGGDFIQGQCGQNIRDSIILTEDIGPCEGVGIIVTRHGITLDGNGHEIIGTGTDNGILVGGKKNVTIKNLSVKGFNNGINMRRGSGNLITANALSGNWIGVSISTTDTIIRNNIIFENDTGMSVTSPSNSIFHNILINNDVQVEDVGDNTWEDTGFGNYWSNYWGEDDGSNGRTAGDYVGDTDLPHEGVDFFPLLDPSIPEQFEPLRCADWWLLWCGGWSPVEVQVTDPFGNVISYGVNEIGENAFYVEDDQVVPGSRLIRVLIHRPCSGTSGEGLYSFQMTGLADLDYSMTSLLSQRGEIVLENSIAEGSLSVDETQNVDIRLIETVGPNGEIIASAQMVVPIDVKPGCVTNSIQIKSAGVIPVAILSLPTFDATAIDPDTIYLEAAGVKLTGNGEKTLSHEQDVNGDGLVDLKCYILTDETQIIVGQAIAILEGNTFDGIPIRGEDFIRLVSN
jgi:hypothetical protein